MGTVSNLILQADCLLEWHSFLSYPTQGNVQAGTAETIMYLKGTYGEWALDRYSCFTRERLDVVFPTLRELARSLTVGKKNHYALDKGLGEVLSKLSLDQRRAMLVKFPPLFKTGPGPRNDTAAPYAVRCLFPAGRFGPICFTGAGRRG